MFEIDGGITPADQKVVFDVSRDMFGEILESDEVETRADAVTHPDAVTLLHTFVDDGHFPAHEVLVLSQLALRDAEGITKMREIEPEDII